MQEGNLGLIKAVDRFQHRPGFKFSTYATWRRTPGARTPPRRAGVDITLTPLIDILFIVLLFLVLTATFTEQTVLRISLPRTATGIHDSGDPGAMRILVDAAGNIFVDGRVGTLDDIDRRLLAIDDKDRARVAISADKRVSHGRVIQIVDRVRQAGIFRLEIETFSGSAQNGSS